MNMKRRVSSAGITRLSIGKKADANRASALIELRVTPKRNSGFDEIADKIMQFEEVESVYLMSGGFDLAVRVNAATMQDIALFVAKRLATLESVLSTATHFILTPLQGRRRGAQSRGRARREEEHDL